MIDLGVNSVLFRDFAFETAAEHIAKAGYDGVEIAAIAGMCEHLDLDRWEAQADDLQATMDRHDLEWLSTEVAALDETRLRPAFEACAELGIPVVNVGPGGESDVEGSLEASIDKLAAMAELADEYGVTLCVKAHVGQSIYDTPTTLRAIEAIDSPGFGIDMDPSHIYRAGEAPEEAVADVVDAMGHIHIRDCPGRSPDPGTIQEQACGRGDIDLYAYCEALVDGGYDGPACLEVIGADGRSLAEVSIVAAESYGYLNACLKHLDAR